MRKGKFNAYRYRFLLFSLLIILTANVGAWAQVDDICREFGFIATLEGPRLSAPFLYGRINLKAHAPRDKFPKINITYQNRGSSPERIAVGRSGNYCFKMGTGSGGILIVEVDGVEVARRQVATLAPAQQREDFDVMIDREGAAGPPGVVPSKLQRPPNPKTADLYRKASEAEAEKDTDSAIRYLKEIVELDAEDFVGWGLLANKLLAKKDYAGSEAALRKAVTLKEDHLPAWLTAGRIRAEQKQHEAAIEVFKHAISLDPASAQVYQLLGESYLQTKQGTLGAEALNKAIELDPAGMAELHLQLAHLYRLAKANAMAAAEYKKFLEKVPNHQDRKKFEKFIADNPAQ